MPLWQSPSGVYKCCKSYATPFQISGTISPAGYYSFQYSITNLYGGFSYNPATGAFTAMILIADDGPSPGNGTTFDVHPITVSVWPTGNQSAAVSATKNVTVHNVAPTFRHPDTNEWLIDIYDYPPGGSYFIVSGEFFDKGTQDDHTVLIDWGDGSQPTVFNTSGNSVYASHGYEPDGNSYTIAVYVVDDDSLSGSCSATANMYLLDLDADSDNSGIIDEDDDPIENIAPGAYVGLNADDDNENEISDLLDDGPIDDEHDLVPMIINWAPAYRNYDPVWNYVGWHVTLTLDPEPTWNSYELDYESVARLYTSQDKSGYIPFAPMSQHYNTPTLTWDADEAFTQTLYVEARSVGVFRFKLELREPGWGQLDSDQVVFKTKPVVSFEKRRIIIADGGQHLPIKIKSTEVWDGNDSGSFKTTDITATSADVEYPFPDYQSLQLDMPFDPVDQLKPGIFLPGTTERIVTININDEAYDEGSERFKMDLYNLSADLVPGITEAFVTIVGIDLRTDINNDATIDPAPIYPTDHDSDDPLGFATEHGQGTKGIPVDGWTPITIDLGDVTDLTGYRVIFEKSAGSVLLTTSQSSATDISGTPFTFGTDEMPTQLWVKGISPGSVIVSGKVVPPEGVDDPGGTVDPDAGGPEGPCYDLDKVRITVVKLEKAQDVDFYANHHLVSDPSTSGGVTDYTALSEWHDENINGSVADAGDRRYPVAFTRGTTFGVTATIKANFAGFGQFEPVNQKITVRARSSHNNIEVYSDVDYHDIGESSFTVTVTPEFDDKVDFLNSFDLQWEVSIDKGNTWVSVGTTTHPVYLTFDNPDISPIYHTVMHLGSAYGKNAADHGSAASVVAAIWDNFADRTVKRVAMSTDWQVIEEAQLVYWGTWAEQNAANASVGTSVADLLSHADGKCGSWARLFVDVLGAQGISATLKGIWPKQIPFPANMVGLHVKNWTFDEAFGWDLPNGYGRAYRQGGFAEAGGIPAQGSANPRSTFTDHMVVEYADQIYDPSYGGGPYTTILDWEASALAGVAFVSLNAQGQQMLSLLKHVPTRQDTQFQ